MGLDARVFQDDGHQIKLAHLRIGDLAGIAELRGEIEVVSGEFPILMNRVIYNGTHCGDEIPAAMVADLKAELDRLSIGSGRLNQFKTELTALCEVAVQHGRSIVF